MKVGGWLGEGRGDEGGWMEGEGSRVDEGMTRGTQTPIILSTIHASVSF